MKKYSQKMRKNLKVFDAKLREESPKKKIERIMEKETTTCWV